MTLPVLIHTVDQETLAGEIEALPDPTDQFIILHMPQQREGTMLDNLKAGVVTILLPWPQIQFVQLLPDTGSDEALSFVRE
jgi:hypothetical protein